MDNTVLKILGLRNRQHALTQAVLKAYPNDTLVQMLVAVDEQVCAALSDAVKTHGPNIGLSPVAMAASVQPKD